MTDKDGNFLWFGNYTGWGCLKEESKVADSAYQPFRLQNQYADRETGLHYNFFRYYEPDAGRFVYQDAIELLGGINFYQFSPNVQTWIDLWGLVKLGGVAPYGSKRHIGVNLDAHKMLRNAFLNDSHLTTITNRQGAKGNPAMGLTKDLHRAAHDAEARLRAIKGIGRII